VATDGRDRASYALALQQAEAVHRTDPGRGGYLTLLGQALYRAGRYEEAHRRLIEALDAGIASTGRASPANFAFAALVLHRLGRADQARRFAIRLHDAMRSSPYAGDEQAIRWRDEVDHVLGHPALDPGAEAVKDVVIGSWIAGWEKQDLAAFLAARADESRQTDARTADPGPYDLTADKARLGGTRKLQFVEIGGEARFYFDDVSATVEGETARFACRMTATAGEWLEVGEMRARLSRRRGSWVIVEERHWPRRRLDGGRLVDCDATYWKSKDDEVERARKSGNLPGLASALFAADRRLEGYEAACKASERPGATGSDWKVRAEAAIAGYQPQDAVRSWAEAIRLEPGLIPPRYVALPRLEPVPPGRESGLKSARSDDASALRFVNRTDRPMRILWVDPGGKPTDYGSIAPGKDLTLMTYATHAWRVTDLAGKPLRHFVATRQASEAVVTSD
jgi:tetratricopeptide (TPR) repeat protein